MTLLLERALSPQCDSNFETQMSIVGHVPVGGLAWLRRHQQMFPSTTTN